MRGKQNFFITFLIIFCSFSAKAQRDLEHWFPPIFKSGPSAYDNNIAEIYIYLSTEKTTPFTVKIFSDNQRIGIVSLSKNSPVKFKIDKLSQILSTSTLNTMKPSKMGLHVAGEKSFVASLRIDGSSAEVMASKGKSGLGTEFFTGMEQVILYGYDPSRMNYQIAVMATKDSTHVKISNYASGITFSDGSKAKELIFTLNKGESYIAVQQKIDQVSQSQFDEFEPDLIGAKITSDKPIIVNSGNVSSHYFGDGPPPPDSPTAPPPYKGGADFTLDQDLPTSKIGKEYFLVTGMTPALVNNNNPKSFIGTERALIIATKDNTKIYFNDENMPTKTLNAGERFFTYPYTPPKYILGTIPTFTNLAGSVISTSGMYIRTSEPAYVYQLTGGFWDKAGVVDKTYYATGMLLSYPIDKNYLSDPRQKLENLVQIPGIDQIGNTGYQTKLSVKAPTDADVKFNGNKPENSPMLGKDGWSYFTSPLLTGSVNVTSDLGINVDVVGGRRFTGFGSSYTGYSNDPFILVNGNCIQEDVLLSLNNIDFEGFQWQRDGVDITGADSPTYLPTLVGSYTCVLSYSTFIYTTEPVQIADCPYVISTTDLGNVCPEFYGNFKVFFAQRNFRF
ncbi:IgGFc-binding protein [Halpernia sp. GG3]